MGGKIHLAIRRIAAMTSGTRGWSIRDAAKLMVAVLLTATLFGVWLTTPIPDVLSRNQWRAVAFAVAALFGVLWSLARWNLSTLVVGFLIGVLVGGTEVALPISHGRMGDAFQSNLELFGAEIVSLTIAATVSAYCVSCFRRNHG